MQRYWKYSSTCIPKGYTEELYRKPVNVNPLINLQNILGQENILQL